MDSKETKKWYYVLPVVSIGIFILAWVWLSSAENSMIPTPLATWEKFLNIMTNPISQAILPVHIWVSLRRVLIAFFFAIVLGVGLGVGLGWSKNFNAVVDPIFEMLRPIPPIAWIPLIILWFGIGETSKIIIVFIGSFVPIVLNTYSGIKEIDPLLVSAGKVLGANRRQILLEITLPATVPAILAGIRTALSSGWMCVVAAEAVLKNKIELKNVSKVYETRDKQVEVLNNLSFEVHENEFLVLLGPGRCGKTVLLNILANLEKQTSGTIEFAGGRPKMGDLGMVFQKYALFPWKTVMGNVEMSQKLKGVDKKVRQEKAQEYINLVGLKGFENSLPKQLSGGMKQRVGIARAYASESDILLLDEPFGALDAQTRYQMEDEIIKIWEKNKKTIIFVTNNVEEALYLGDRILLLSSRPAEIKKEYVVDLPRPRSYTDKAFLEYRNEIVDNTDLDI